MFLGLGAAAAVPLTAEGRVRPVEGAPSTSGTLTAQPAGGERLRGVSATLLCDALTRLGHDRARFTLAHDIRATVATEGTMIGPAVTTQYAPGRGGSADDIRRFVFDPVDAAPAGSVWVIESGTTERVSMLGELIVVACRQRGLAGIVTDSGCRDIEAIGRLDLPLFSTGTVLYGPGAAIHPVAANVPVTCGGAVIRPGDLVAADVDGALVVPVEAIDEVARLVEELQGKEDATRAALARGASLRDAYQF
jgi:4-hydroxy-4-methyl-2-oxoglutarate aldolase